MNFAYCIVCLAFGFCVVDAINFLRPRRQTKCSSRQFKCNNGQCISEFDICDGARNCVDGSDETQAICNQFGPECQSHTFRCAYGACVDAASKCNGVQNCADNSDELLMECKKKNNPITSKCRNNDFMCTSGQCINSFLVCDGTSQCEDHSDETIAQCINITCAYYSFQCAYGACIERHKKCNKVFDCIDHSDESDELCDFLETPKPITVSPRPRPRPQPTPTLERMCVLPEKPNDGKYTVECLAGDQSLKCHGVEGTPVQEQTILTYTCKQGYVLKDDQQFLLCLNGKWNSDLPTCLKLCHALRSDSLDLNCIYQGESVPCNKTHIPGTIVEPKCKPTYNPKDGSSVFEKSVCRSNGRWDRKLYTCSPECGKSHESASQTLISHGNLTQAGEFPWHVAIYATSDFKLLCSGTIINQYIILTAAHCVYDKKLNKKLNPGDLKISVGKYQRDFYQKEIYQKDFEVRQIISSVSYKGSQTSYSQDIAVLELVTSIEFNFGVVPVCIDWDEEIKLINGLKGTVVGWGLDENNQVSTNLKGAELPYLDYKTCRLAIDERYLTYDKLCAGNTKGAGVGQGDSGGGLTFIKDERHFIKGIVSLKLNNIGLFTHIDHHKTWLNNTIVAVETSHTYY